MILRFAGMLHDLGKVRLNFYMNEKVEDERFWLLTKQDI